MQETATGHRAEMGAAAPEGKPSWPPSASTPSSQLPSSASHDLTDVKESPYGQATETGEALDVSPAADQFTEHVSAESLSQEFHARGLDALASPPVIRRRNTKQVLKASSSEGCLQSLRRQAEGAEQKRTGSGGEGLAPRLARPAQKLFYRMKDIIGELTKPVFIQDTNLSLEQDSADAENSLITYIDDSGNEGNCRVHDVVCMRMDIYSEPTRKDILGQAMIVKRTSGLKHSEWLDWLRSVLLLGLLGRFINHCLGPASAVLVTLAMVASRMLSLHTLMHREVNTFFRHYEPVIFCLSAFDFLNMVLCRMRLGWVPFLVVLTVVSFITFMEWQRAMGMLRLPAKVRLAQPSYPIIVTLPASTFICTRADFLSVCRDRIAHVEVFPYWVEVALSVGLHPELYNSVTVRRYIAYFMTFAMPIINLFYVSSLFLPIVTSVYFDLLSRARRDMALRFLYSSFSFLFSFLPTPGLPLVIQRGLQTTYKLVTSSLSALSWFSSYLSPFDALLTQIRIRFSFLWTLTLSEPLKNGLHLLVSSMSTFLQAFLPLLRLLNNIYALVKRPLDAIRSFMRTLAVKPVSEIKAMVFRAWLLLLGRRRPGHTTEEYVVGARNGSSSHGSGNMGDGDSSRPGTGDSLPSSASTHLSSSSSSTPPSTLSPLSSSATAPPAVCGPDQAPLAAARPADATSPTEQAQGDGVPAASSRAAAVAAAAATAAGSDTKSDTFLLQRNDLDGEEGSLLLRRRRVTNHRQHKQHKQRGAAMTEGISSGKCADSDASCEHRNAARSFSGSGVGGAGASDVEPKALPNATVPEAGVHRSNTMPNGRTHLHRVATDAAEDTVRTGVHSAPPVLPGRRASAGAGFFSPTSTHDMNKPP